MFSRNDVEIAEPANSPEGDGVGENAQSHWVQYANGTTAGDDPVALTGTGVLSFEGESENQKLDVHM